jgi:adenylyltransferase/sulfurtransferase
MQEKTVHELKEMIDGSIPFQLIDVREQYEHEACNINGELISLSEIFDSSDRISKELPVIIYCRSGARSAAAIAELEKRFGFTNLYNLKGGITAYSKEIDSSLHVI